MFDSVFKKIFPGFAAQTCRTNTDEVKDGEDLYHHMCLTRVVIADILRTLRTTLVYNRDHYVFLVELLATRVYEQALTLEQDEKPFIWASDASKLQESVRDKAVRLLPFLRQTVQKVVFFRGELSSQ